jgi:metal-responsive CopG/Arc/MetJ family transcriptional regulator
MAITKTKVSLTVSTDLVELVDREARRAGTTRSAVFEQLVRSGAQRAQERSLNEMTAAYYATLTPDDRAESEAIAHASSRRAKSITYDAQPRANGGRTRRKATR